MKPFPPGGFRRPFGGLGICRSSDFAKTATRDERRLDFAVPQSPDFAKIHRKVGRPWNPEYRTAIDRMREVVNSEKNPFRSPDFAKTATRDERRLDFAVPQSPDFAKIHRKVGRPWNPENRTAIDRMRGVVSSGKNPFRSRDFAKTATGGERRLDFAVPRSPDFAKIHRKVGRPWNPENRTAIDRMREVVSSENNQIRSPDCVKTAARDERRLDFAVPRSPDFAKIHRKVGRPWNPENRTAIDRMREVVSSRKDQFTVPCVTPTGLGEAQP